MHKHTVGRRPEGWVTVTATRCNELLITAHLAAVRSGSGLACEINRYRPRTEDYVLPGLAKWQTRMIGTPRRAAVAPLAISGQAMR